MTTPLIRRLTLQNFLSYGPEGVSVDLLPLNVLIGPNASGKSNLLEALAVLRGAAGDLPAVIREGGGIGEYMWKDGSGGRTVSIEAVVATPAELSNVLILYEIQFGQLTNRVEVSGEIIGFWDEPGKQHPELVYNFHHDMAVLRPKGSEQYEPTHLVKDFKRTHSVLSQRRDPDQYPELTFLADTFSTITLFQEWNVGRRSAVRLPQPTDLPSDFLLSDGSNLGLVLHDLSQTSAQREQLITYLRRFYDRACFISTKIQGGTLQLFIEEEGGQLIPTTRLSDGTLRYLCLLAILCHPNPPPVVAIEEPELGLHPDILPTIAELLKKASERTQLFVTTHSDALVSALSDTPESILVCESMPNGTTIERLDPQKLKSWLDEYRLGEIWRMGEIGGNRW